MKVTVDSVVSYNVNKIDIAPIHIFKENDDTLSFQTAFTWLDVDGKALKSSSKRFTQSQIIESSSDKPNATLLMSALSSLFEQGVNPMLRMTIIEKTNSIQVVSFRADLVDGKNKYTQKIYIEDELVAHGLSSAILISAISQIATSLTNT